jgi:hypothetical protein
MPHVGSLCSLLLQPWMDGCGHIHQIVWFDLTGHDQMRGESLQGFNLMLCSFKQCQCIKKVLNTLLCMLQWSSENGSYWTHVRCHFSVASHSDRWYPTSLTASVEQDQLAESERRDKDITPETCKHCTHVDFWNGTKVTTCQHRSSAARFWCRLRGSDGHNSDREIYSEHPAASQLPLSQEQMHPNGLSRNVATLAPRLHYNYTRTHAHWCQCCVTLFFRRSTKIKNGSPDPAQEMEVQSSRTKHSNNSMHLLCFTTSFLLLMFNWQCLSE